MSDLLRRGELSDAQVQKLRRAVRGEVRLDAFSRGRYATDASIYQMTPLAVVIPETMDDVAATLDLAREAGVPVLPRGGGTSQCGQTVNEAIVLDFSRHLNRVLEIDAEAGEAVVEPGLVLDHLNDALKPHGLWYPVDVSTSSRATLGGMTANNSCGARSIRYGASRDNVLSVDALLADGSRARFEHLDPAALAANAPAPAAELFRDLLALGARERGEIERRFPQLIRRVGGYNIDALIPGADGVNMAGLLVGSEGTLAVSERIRLRLAPVLREKVLGVCHFPTFREALESVQRLVTLDPTAVELMDSTMIALGRDIPMFRPVVESFVRGAPAALLMVEFAEPDRAENLRRLDALEAMMADLGYRWDDPGKKPGGVLRAVDPALQGQIVEFRKQGLNIMMSMKSEGKPVSFVEDCAVALPDLADYAENLTAIFRKHRTEGTWYAHASVGTLHVRPVLNLKLDADLKAMRAIAEEAFELVRRYKGSHSGEHGDGIVRSEHHRVMFGERMVASFEEVKDRFDPAGLLNPGKIVRAPRMDDREVMRYGPDYGAPQRDSVFRWAGYSGAGRGLQGAVEMCNNNGACRKLGDGVMCPSYRVTRNEQDVTRGRANTLRLALTGQLGAGALASDEMMETLKLCVSCKGCKRECPTGVDMAKLKIEALAARRAAKGVALRERIIAHLPRYAPAASRAGWLMNLRDRVPGLARVSESLVGLSARRTLPRWSDRPFRDAELSGEGSAVLFADTFNRYFEPENLRAAAKVLAAAGAPAAAARPTDGGRPLCCGRTYLSAGMIPEAKAEARRLLAALAPLAERGAAIVGLEPSCLYTLRDELPDLLPGAQADAVAAQAVMFEEHLARGLDSGDLRLTLKPGLKQVLLHGHCHQKAFGGLGAVERVLRSLPEAEVTTIRSSCCGMAGAFGYGAETHDVSMRMGELSLLPAVRAAAADAAIVADGFSCRHQIADGAGRPAVHVARLLAEALAD